jgi:uncharacterized membrane protein YkvA (DUF1232 family)
MSIFRGNPLANAFFLGRLPRYLRLYVRLMGDARVPVRLKLIVVAALAYLISPIDLTPDLLVPVLGQLDDALVLWLAFRAFVRLCPPRVVAEHSRLVGL